MKKVAIYIIVDFRSGGPSHWESSLRYKQRQRPLSGSCSVESIDELAIKALSDSLAALKEPCHVDVYAEPDGLRGLVVGEDARISGLLSRVGQFIWLRSNDLPEIASSMKARLSKRE